MLIIVQQFLYNFFKEMKLAIFPVIFNFGPISTNVFPTTFELFDRVEASNRRKIWIQVGGRITERFDYILMFVKQRYRVVN